MGWRGDRDLVIELGSAVKKVRSVGGALKEVRSLVMWASSIFTAGSRLMGRGLRAVGSLLVDFIVWGIGSALVTFLLGFMFLVFVFVGASL